VNAADEAVAGSNYTNVFTALRLISVPALPAPGVETSELSVSFGTLGAGVVAGTGLPAASGTAMTDAGGSLVTVPDAMDFATAAGVGPDSSAEFSRPVTVVWPEAAQAALPMDDVEPAAVPVAGKRAAVSPTFSTRVRPYLTLSPMPGRFIAALAAPAAQGDARTGPHGPGSALPLLVNLPQTLTVPSGHAIWALPANLLPPAARSAEKAAGHWHANVLKEFGGGFFLDI
jgi:hypothetical protein